MNNSIYKFIQFLKKKDKIIPNSLTFLNSYIELKKYKDIIEVLKILYKKSNNLVYIIQIAYIHINQKNITKAINILEKHNKVFNLLISKVLVELYIKYHFSEIDKIIKLYLSIYNEENNENIAFNIINFYVSYNKIDKAINFLENSFLDNEILFKLYLHKNYLKKAIILAKSIFIENKEDEWLYRYISLLYEETLFKKDKNKLQTVINKLKYLISKNHKPKYFNFYGFILIDKEIDIKKGINLVKKSLINNKDNIYYLDSLAWGYFKNRECTKAKLLMKKIFTINKYLNEQNIFFHRNKILNCNKLR